MTGFIDLHVHPPAAVLVDDGLRPYLPASGLPDGPAGFEELADRYAGLGGTALVHAFDAGTAVGSAALSNAKLAESIAPFPSLAGLASVDPHRGEAAVVAAHDALRLGLKGLFFHPAAQQFDPTGRRTAPLWDMAEQLRLPVVIHCGTTSLGAGRPGGAGIALDVADPMRMDRVAAAHPGLVIVLTGVTPPWEEAAMTIAAHKANVHLAPPAGALLRTVAGGPLTSKVMMGSGFPFSTPEDWLEDWASAGAPDEADAAVRLGNAAALFGV